MPISLTNPFAIGHPGYVPGRYYQGLGDVSADSSSSGGLAINSITYVPFCIHSDLAIDRLAIYCSGTKTDGNARIGIYSNLNGLPKNLLVDAGNLAAATSGVKEAVISLALTRGWYWFAGTTNTAPLLYCRTSFLGSNYIFGQNTPTSLSASGALRDISVSPYLSLPTPAPVDNLSLLTGNVAPLFWFRVA